MFGNMDESSSSYSSEQEDYLKDVTQLHEINKNKYNHRHQRKFYSGICSKSRKHCRCDKCGPKKYCCESFCKKSCFSTDLSSDTSLQMTSDVVVMPYPVPVLVLVKNSSAAETTTATETTTTTESIPTTESTTTTKSTTTTESSTTTETTTEIEPETPPKMNLTEPPRADRFMKFHVDSINTNPVKRFHIITEKPYKRSFNQVPNFKIKPLPKYGLIKIPEALSNMLVHRYNEKRKVLLREKRKLLVP